MGWNVSAETLAFIIVLIISVYSRRSQAVPSHKNLMFRACLATTLGAIGTNLASTLMITYAPIEIQPLTWFITMCYFVLTPLLGTVYFYYAIAVVSEAKPVSRTFIAIGALPCILYFICAITNVATGCLFSFNEAGTYQQGPLILTTYLVFYFYCIACFVLVVGTSAPIDPDIKRILAVFPLVAVAFIAVQQAFPTCLLSGSAAACSLLIIYLYLQNKRLSLDLLTGVPNRNEFLSMVTLMHEKKRAFTAVLVSLSNFKFINDKFGHDNGDRFLRKFARYLESLVDGAHVYRYSGDQFAIIIDEGEVGEGGGQHTQADAAGPLLALLQDRLSTSWSIGDRAYTVAAAIGVASHPAIAEHPGDLVAALEYATAQAKRRGPNTLCRCTPAMINAIHRHETVASIVREAVAHDSFDVHFQPIWSEEGLISDVAFLVLERSCAFVSAYRTEHPNTAFRGVSVNFSAVQFMQNDLADAVLAVVERHNIPASCLRIELTESTLIANPDVVRAFMETMHAHGVRFYLDDFGTGYSSLSTMIELPFDVIKVDKSILWSVAADGEQAEFLGYLASCFASFKSKALAEGVETQDQYAYLQRIGCDLMQGYLFSSPLPADGAAAAIAASEERRAEGAC